MIILRTEHNDRPNEVSVYLTQDQYDGVNMSLLSSGKPAFAELSEEERRGYCRAILGLFNQDTRSQRYVVDLDDNTRLDSKELGRELVERFAEPQDPDVFDPDYYPVDFTFRILDDEGDRLFAGITPDSDFDTPHIVRALDAARLAVQFSFNPPSLA